MYNGIGLTTPRGTGTNGYVTRNLSHVGSKRERVEYRTEEDIKRVEAMLAPKKTNPDILEHERKRQVEIECMKLRAQLEDDG